MIKHTERQMDITVVLSGQAGQGIQTVETLLTRILKAVGLHVYATKEYMSRIRGGRNSTLIRFSDQPVKAFLDRIDILVPLHEGAIAHLGERIGSETLIVGEEKVEVAEFDEKSRFVDIAFTRLASEIGDKVYSNTVAVGALVNVLSVDRDKAIDCLKQYFQDKSPEIIANNIEALKAGYEAAGSWKKSGVLNIKGEGPAESDSQILVNGAQAVGLGAIGGGCDFVSSYPMSPSTGVLTFLAQKGREFGVIVEQAEDEIAAINMAIGAWYAGARAMVTTSGGGFALMTEGLSLAGMVESPLVIHLAQRPGPATGLPTRTEQGDLELALYAGHGEFPRIILAPGSLEDGFYLTHQAFNLADKYQVPVFILTDQYFMDTYYNIDPFELKGLAVEKYIVEAADDYKRFELTGNGISPRAIPGWGKGLVCIDSDEHDEQGHITEDQQVRINMVNKRLKKLEAIQQAAVEPTLWGPEHYKNLVICWGSTYHIVCEAVNRLQRKDTAVVHFKQIYPLPIQAVDYINKADKTIVIENNATAQFARFIKTHAEVQVDHTILRYDGLCFASDSLASAISHFFSG